MSVIDLHQHRKKKARQSGEMAGLAGTDEKQPRQCSGTVSSLQDFAALRHVAERMDAFNRLRTAFGRLGWNLYPLSDESTLATLPAWGITQVCPDYRAAAALLRRIGGC